MPFMVERSDIKHFNQTTTEIDKYKTTTKYQKSMNKK